MSEASDETFQMFQVHDVADTFDEALGALRGSLGEARRQLAAWSLVNFTGRATLNVEAHELRRTLDVSAVEVNAISAKSQVTVAGAPTVVTPRSIPVGDSLCVISATLGRPVAVDDIAHDPMLADHPAHGQWASWASAPIVVGDGIAGSVCALERDQVRHWSPQDQRYLEESAARIGKMVDGWAWTGGKSWT